jgi:hypothetical protein
VRFLYFHINRRFAGNLRRRSVIIIRCRIAAFNTVLESLDRLAET